MQLLQLLTPCKNLKNEYVIIIKKEVIVRVSLNVNICELEMNFYDEKHQVEPRNN